MSERPQHSVERRERLKSLDTAMVLAGVRQWHSRLQGGRRTASCPSPYVRVATQDGIDELQARGIIYIAEFAPIVIGE